MHRAFIAHGQQSLLLFCADRAMETHPLGES
jgi:hypothetical protein